MNTQLVDVTVHVDQTLDSDGRNALENCLRALEGVMSVHMPDDKPHLVVVGYNPANLDSQHILNCVTNLGVHAELVGL